MEDELSDFLTEDTDSEDEFEPAILEQRVKNKNYLGLFCVLLKYFMTRMYGV